ncbi:MAG: hypothetical protein QGG25_00245, partial [Phycisphaerae bacterium]|nr:hypothetical protein [Phycisphaerae bacterium]
CPRQLGLSHRQHRLDSLLAVHFGVYLGDDRAAVAEYDSGRIQSELLAEVSRNIVAAPLRRPSVRK